MPRIKLEFEENKRKGEFDEVLCTKCGGPTRHAVIFSCDEAGSEAVYHEISVDWHTSYQIIQCGGCKTVSYRTLTSSSEDTPEMVGPNEYEYIESQTLYPHRSEEDMPIGNFKEVPYEIQSIYEEAINCINSGSHILAAAGLRTVIDGICEDLEVSDGPVTDKNTGNEVRKSTLEGKISGLHEQGHLTKHLAETLHEHRFLGNSALHEMVRHKKRDLILAAQIIEHVLQTIYEVKKKSERLKAEREKRERKKDR